MVQNDVEVAAPPEQVGPEALGSGWSTGVSVATQETSIGSPVLAPGRVPQLERTQRFMNPLVLKPLQPTPPAMFSASQWSASCWSVLPGPTSPEMHTVPTRSVEFGMQA